MKTIKVILFIGMLFLLSCNNDQNTKLTEKMLYVKTELGGCNIQSDLRNDNSEIEDDTVIITISADSVNVFVNLPYSCKLAPFETQVETIGDIMYMYIIDKCWVYDGAGDDCYQRCMCNYTFDFVFKYQGEVNQKYKILLIDPRREEPSIISESIINSKKR